MKRLVVILIGLACLAGAGAVASGASFTYGSISTVTAGAAHIHNWLKLYSQVGDPDGDTGYYSRYAYTPTTPAASGTDEALVVNLGAYPNKNTNYDSNRVLKLKTVPTFPVLSPLVTSITATFSLLADVGGNQPLTSMGVKTWGGTGVTGTTVTVSNWAASTKYQLNLRTRFGSWTKQQYNPKVRVIVKYSGFTTTYYQYDIPVAVTYGP